MNYISAITDTRSENTAASSPPELVLMLNTLICSFFPLKWYFHNPCWWQNRFAHTCKILDKCKDLNSSIFCYLPNLREVKDVFQGVVWNLLLLLIWLKCKTVLRKQIQERTKKNDILNFLYTKLLRLKKGITCKSFT